MRNLLLLLNCIWISTLLNAQDKSFSFDEEMRRLRSQLPATEDTNRVKWLLKVTRLHLNSTTVRADSAIIYAGKGYELATKLVYKTGIIDAAIMKGQILLQLSQPDDGIIYYRIARGLAQETGDTLRQTIALRGIGQSLWYQGKYREARDTIYASINYFLQMGQYYSVCDAFLTISTIYADEGNYEKGFEMAQQALALSRKYDNRPNGILSLIQIGKLYRSIGDYAAAIDYYNQGYAYKPDKADWTSRHLSHCMGDIYMDKKMYDSALYYYRFSFSGNPKSPLSRLKMGYYFIAIRNYDSAFQYFNGLYSMGDKSGEGNIRYNAMLGLGTVYFHRKDYVNALNLVNKVLEKAKTNNARLTIRDACEVLSSIYSATNQPGRALVLYKEYEAMKDSILNDQLKGRLYEFKRIAEDERNLAKIALLQKETRITEQNLRAARTSASILIIGIVVLLVLGTVIFWTISLKRKNEKLRNESSRMEWEHAAKDLEMQALRARMNPHFIFNCLSSINRFILKNEPDQASDYLTRFSRLIRLVLLNSQNPLILLEEEVEMLRLYIEMEQLRFRHQFNYSITYTNDIKPGNIVIPPLLLQPFCENAIWHGLMHKNGKGNLSIAFGMEKGVLKCIITDDGVGRERSKEIKGRSGEEKKSFGLKLTAERLALFNEDNLVQSSWSIEDVLDENGTIAGTRVTLDIRYKEFIEQTA